MVAISNGHFIVVKCSQEYFQSHMTRVVKVGIQDGRGARFNSRRRAPMSGRI
jgi:hypothetical protein